jgi:hypothetical protein
VVLFGKKAADHPAVKRALRICESAMLDPGGILETQQFLKPGHPKLGKVLELLPPDLQKQMTAKLATGDWTSRKVWNELSTGLKALGREKLVQELILEFAWPRLDIGVSKQMNHLLKAPFCVHPKSGKVCVPIHAHEADEFNPDTVPTLRGLVTALNAGGANLLEPHIKAFSKGVEAHIIAISEARRSGSEAAQQW